MGEELLPLIDNEYITFRLKALLCKSWYSVRIRENTDQKKLHIWTLSTQCGTVSRKSKEFPNPFVVKSGL